MRKILIVAWREYLAAVQTKAFIIGLLLMPVMMGGSILVPWLVKDMVDTDDKVFALVDRTPGQQLAPLVQRAVADYDQTQVVDPQSGKQVKPRFVLEAVSPSPGDPESINLQRYELSERVRAEKLFGFVEILGEQARAEGRDAPTGTVILRYQSNRPIYETFAKLVAAALAKDLRDAHAQKAGLSAEGVNVFLQPVALESRGLSGRDAVTGAIIEGPEHNRVAAYLVPAGMMMLMFVVVLMSATPLMQGVVEEKMQRIAEVLLGSVQPFTLMMGKLLGMAAVSLTIAGVYLAGTYWAAIHFGFAEMVGSDLLAWFVAFQILAALMFGSLFIAIGAACTDMKETQNLMWPVMLLAMFPLFILSNVVQEPNSPISTIFSFIPFFTPMLMIARQAAPPGIAVWQPLLGALAVLATTLLCVYVAGRIFRVGLLLQGKGASFADMARWAFRG
jgi:ABC-2 type transport system permease protein